MVQNPGVEGFPPDLATAAEETSMRAVTSRDPVSHHAAARPPVRGTAIFADLARLFGADPGQASIVSGGATDCWRRLLSERLAPGDAVLVPCFGPESEQLAAIARGLDLAVETVAGSGGAMPYGALCRRLRDDVAGRLRAVLVPAAEASTGETADIGAIRALMDRAFHDALLLVDATEVLETGCFAMARWGVDVAVADCRMAPALPDGLALVAVADADARHRAAPAGPLRLVAGD
jgi:alanine-glyoxylate transaminase / serine-glyoxylate transaminase / serine-pyruvate transaminase